MYTKSGPVIDWLRACHENFVLRLAGVFLPFVLQHIFAEISLYLMTRETGSIPSDENIVAAAGTAW